MSDDTPFQVWMDAAVDEMQMALDQAVWPRVPPSLRVHLFKSFQALVHVMEEVVKANAGPVGKPSDD